MYENGINIISWGAGGTTLDVTGTVNSTMTAIYTSTVAGDINVTTDGIVSGNNGIRIYQYSYDDIELNFAGTVAATTGQAVYAAGNGNITLESTADTTSGSVSVSGNGAIALDALSPGDIIIHQTGDVTTYGNVAIRAQASNGDISVTWNGAITSVGGDGMRLINMTQPGEINVDHTGSITASDDALDLSGNGDINVKVNSPKFPRHLAVTVSADVRSR